MNLIRNFILLNLFILNVFAIDIPPRPLPVIDQVGVLAPKVVKDLTNALYNVERKSGNEIALLIIESLQGDSIENVSIKIVDQWKLGKSKKDNGVLFLIALKDRKMRIEVGKGLEGDLTDLEAGRIIRAVQPFFKRGDYTSGVAKGLTLIIEKTGGNLAQVVPIRNSKKGRGRTILDLIFIIIALIIIFMSKFTSGRRGIGRNSYYYGSGGGSSGGGFSSGGGSFGGGGGFSGGGSSGGW